MQYIQNKHHLHKFYHISKHVYQMKYLYEPNDSYKLYFMKYQNKANDT